MLSCDLSQIWPIDVTCWGDLDNNPKSVRESELRHEMFPSCLTQAERTIQHHVSETWIQRKQFNKAVPLTQLSIRNSLSFRTSDLVAHQETGLVQE